MFYANSHSQWITQMVNHQDTYKPLGISKIECQRECRQWHEIWITLWSSCSASLCTAFTLFRIASMYGLPNYLLLDDRESRTFTFCFSCSFRRWFPPTISLFFRLTTIVLRKLFINRSAYPASTYTLESRSYNEHFGKTILSEFIVWIILNSS